MRLVLQSVSDLINLLEARLGHLISLTDRLALLVFKRQSRYVHMVHIGSVQHDGGDEVGAEDEYRAVREGDERLQLLQSRLQDICRLLAVLDRVQCLQEPLDAV